jgi:hypothetical protein
MIGRLAYDKSKACVIDTDSRDLKPGETWVELLSSTYNMSVCSIISKGFAVLKVVTHGISRNQARESAELCFSTSS